MSITAEVLADSLAPCGKRLTTVLLDGFPKFLQAELNTHRMLSRGSASSRAIPNERLCQRVVDDPALPVWWGKNRSGMQAREELDEREKNAAMYLWRHARDKMLEVSADLANLGVHKQLCNRLIEPWMPVAIIVSATEWENFFRLRCHPDAQPEMRVAAEAIRDAMSASEPSVIQQSGYHLPLVRAEDYASDIDLNGLVKLSVARCARVSYLNHDGVRDPQADFDLYDRLLTSGHWGPFEHAARALATPERVGNFIGWRQHRADADPHFIG